MIGILKSFIQKLKSKSKEVSDHIHIVPTDFSLSFYLEEDTNMYLMMEQLFSIPEQKYKSVVKKKKSVKRKKL